MVADPKIAESYLRATLSFVQTELETAETFATIAESSNDAAKTERNRKNARKGYDTALRFLASVNATAGEQREIHKKLEKIRSKLKVLGETF